MTGRFVLIVIALGIGAWCIDKAPSWSIVAVVLCLMAAWSLMAYDRKREQARRRKPLRPVDDISPTRSRRDAA